MQKATTNAQAKPSAAWTRQQLEQTIEALIALLDELDGDADLEAACEDEGFDADGEPWLGWPERHGAQGFALSVTNPRLAFDGEINEVPAD
jgi:hypothetical protein